jgi:hypothetical protein
MSRGIWGGTLLLAAASGAAAAGLPETPPPDFVNAGSVMQSVGTMLDRLKPLTEGEGRTWQAIRARSMCETVRIELRQAQRSRSYTAETGERRWRECAEAYARVP